ncbi:uncharacterized protein C5orf34 homolog isoform X2 [Protopterus annectens]|uniref:uncharacterized protein C5orf34 homolog isoform X2 n=1 Tax=Protopterus annectens TaxID=7888 RepID=UPI001CF9B997|nr:uncharacterized protein C5orf34 homolog isoform X2 [Protopterus annectens]
MELISLMVLYDDDSLLVQYSDGSCLQLSPCGSEFLFEKVPPASAHPLQQPERIRQRTQFVISIYREKVLHALEFRNRFARRLFLPGSIIPNEKQYSFFSISSVTWPSPDVKDAATFADDGTVKVRSMDGNATLHLASQQLEFTMEFISRISQKSPVPFLVKDKQHCKNVDTGKHQKSCKSSIVEDISEISKTSSGRKHIFSETGLKSTKLKIPEEIMNQKGSEGLQSCCNSAVEYVTVVQHHSVSFCPEEWKYPLFLALHPNHVDKAVKTNENECKKNSQDVLKEVKHDRTTLLPDPLPLNCRAPHLHRWSHNTSFLDGEQDIRTPYSSPELLKVVWCRGVVFRLFHGTASSVEVYPGDGSVLHSTEGTYFTHHMTNRNTGLQEERMYIVSSPPPDIPGSLYSVSSIITRAARILQYCYNARLSLKLPDICCWKQESLMEFQMRLPLLLEESFIPCIGRFTAYSDSKVHIIFCDGVTLHMIYDFHALHEEIQTCETPNSEAYWQQHLQNALTGWCQLVLPDGQCHLVQIHHPGKYERYVTAAVKWCQWVTKCHKGRTSSNDQYSGQDNTVSVIAELQKIQRFNFLLENNMVLKQASSTDAVCNLTSRNQCSEENLDSSEQQNELNIATVLENNCKIIQDIESLLSTTISRKLNPESKT